MRDSDTKEFGIIFFLFFIVFLIGFISGNLATKGIRDKYWQRELIQREYAQYNKTTGDWEWIVNNAEKIK